MASVGEPPNKALQLTVKGWARIIRGRVWRRASAFRATTVAALASSLAAIRWAATVTE